MIRAMIAICKLTSFPQSVQFTDAVESIKVRSRFKTCGKNAYMGWPHISFAV